MAKDKKSFILYADLKHTVDKLPDDKAGELFKLILSYVNDENPETEDLLLSIAFEPIKRQLKRDLEAYEGVKETYSIKGKEGNLKRWNEDIYNDYKKGNHTLEQALSIAEHRKASPPDKKASPPIGLIAVNDTVNVTVNDINIDWDSLISVFNKITNKNIRVINDKTRKQIKARLKEGYTKADILKAIQNCYNDSHHKEHKHKYLTLEFISRPDKLDRFANMETNIAPKPLTDSLYD
jgi:uncharacterized phage protein (TIGR02220 family)